MASFCSLSDDTRTCKLEACKKLLLSLMWQVYSLREDNIWKHRSEFFLLSFNITYWKNAVMISFSPDSIFLATNFKIFIVF